MLKTPPTIPQFGLSPLAKAGVRIRPMKGWEGGEEHAVFAPHRDAHYLLLLATRGKLTLHLDFEEVVVVAPALLLVFPGQVHHLLHAPELEGWIISFDPALLDGELQGLLARGLPGPLPLDSHRALYRQAVALFGVLEEVQATAPDAYTGRTIHALLQALLSRIAGQFLAAAPSAKGKESRGAYLEQAFNHLLQQHYRAWKQPARYAAELAVSVAHLNDTVKELTGSSLSAHIQQRAILEAKRLLCFTDLSVKEIGYGLGYHEPVYFNKLFKKVAGCTPLHFRQQFRG